MGDCTSSHRRRALYSRIFCVTFLLQLSLDEKLYDFVVSVEAGGSEWSGVGLGGGVDVGSSVHQQLDNLCVSGGGGAPEGRGALDGLAVKGDGSGLLDVGPAALHQVLDHLAVSIATGEHQRRRSVGLGRHQLGNLFAWTVIQENLKNKTRKIVK